MFKKVILAAFTLLFSMTALIGQTSEFGTEAEVRNRRVRLRATQ